MRSTAEEGTLLAWQPFPTDRRQRDSSHALEPCRCSPLAWSPASRESACSSSAWYTISHHARWRGLG